jgi:presenilin-like A22 family membrane protease
MSPLLQQKYFSHYTYPVGSAGQRYANGRPKRHYRTDRTTTGSAATGGSWTVDHRGVVGVSSADAEVGAGRSFDLDLPASAPMLGTYVMALLAMAVGVLAAPALAGEGLHAFENPSSGANLLEFAFGIGLGTGSILAVQRLGYGQVVVRVLFLGIFAYDAALLSTALVAGQAVPVVVGVAVFALLWLHPEWYVLDVVGFAFCAALVGLLGISLVPGLVVALLAAAALYDAYSVYVSEHMQSLVDGGLDMDIPMAFVVPRDLGFSMDDVDDLSALADGDADVALLGYGDALFPGLVAVSAGHFLGPGTETVLAPTLVAGVPYLNAPALGALAGGVVGMVGLKVLMSRVERAHPALVVLNPGVVGGYLLGAVAAGVPLTAALGL